MDRISGLSDELLLKILAFLPTTKDVVPTMVLSKRWYPLWMMVPKLVYDDSCYEDVEDRRKFSQFVDRSLFLHEAPVIENLCFRLGKTCGAEDIQVWIRAANKCSVRELIIEIDSSSSASPVILPRSLYTRCGMLVKLLLKEASLVDHVTSSVSFPSLKTLDLISVKYPGDEFVKNLLSNCPVLEDLHVEQCPYDNVTIFTVRVPSLMYLTVYKSHDRVENNAEGYVIDAPSLEYLCIHDVRGGFCNIENEMPDIVEAKVAVGYHRIRKIMGSITSVSQLHICYHMKAIYPVGSVFHNLEDLTLGTCETEWWNILLCLLIVSPKLQSLKLEQCHEPRNPQRRCWSEPSSVPECLLSSLETLKWFDYEGTEEDKEVAAFILRNGSCLKEVTISDAQET